MGIIFGKEDNMTNGERLYKSNMYDILCRIQNTFVSNDFDYFCVIDAINGKELDCNRCIEHWLNKEEADW